MTSQNTGSTFSKSKGHNSDKNCSIVPKIELHLDIFLVNLYTKFHFNMCNFCEENERKLANNRNFSKSKGHNLCRKLHDWTQNQTWPRYMYRGIITINLNTKFHFNAWNSWKESERKLQIIGISKGHNSGVNCRIVPKTWPRYYVNNGLSYWDFCELRIVIVSNYIISIFHCSVKNFTSAWPHFFLKMIKFSIIFLIILFSKTYRKFLKLCT